MNKEKKKYLTKVRRKKRVNIKGSEERPRFSVFRSLKHISVQIINDKNGTTLISASDKEIKNSKGMRKTEVAAEVGKLVAKKSLEKDINTVIFDKGGSKYHGRVKALADSAREQGLNF